MSQTRPLIRCAAQAKRHGALTIHSKWSGTDTNSARASIDGLAIAIAMVARTLICRRLTMPELCILILQLDRSGEQLPRAEAPASPRVLLGILAKVLEYSPLNCDALSITDPITASATLMASDRIRRRASRRSCFWNCSCIIEIKDMKWWWKDEAFIPIAEASRSTGNR